MKKIFPMIAVPVLLVTLGFGQTPATTTASDPASIKGCLAGSDGNFTVAENGTSQTFKISTSSVDLKPHVGHDVELIGKKADGADKGFAVTGLNMISEHCATPTASTPAIDNTPAASASAPATDTKTSAGDPVVTGTAATTTTTTTTTASAPVVVDNTAAARAPVATDTQPAASAPLAPETASTATASSPAVTDQASTATAAKPADTSSAPMTARASAPAEELPNTATPLPLLGLLGMGLLGTGILATGLLRRPRTS